MEERVLNITLGKRVGICTLIYKGTDSVVNRPSKRERKREKRDAPVRWTGSDRTQES